MKLAKRQLGMSALCDVILQTELTQLSKFPACAKAFRLNVKCKQCTSLNLKCTRIEMKQYTSLNLKCTRIEMNPRVEGQANEKWERGCR